MPASRLVKAVTTRQSIGALWAAAEATGEVTIHTATEHACKLIRNKLYAHRARDRKANARGTGLEISPLDKFSISYGHDPERDTDPWRLTITDTDMVEFTIEVDVEATPDLHFDVMDTDVPQAPVGEGRPDFDVEHDDTLLEIARNGGGG